MWAEDRAAIVTCEDCGIIQVDPAGNCISIDCFRSGEDGHGGKILSAEKEAEEFRRRAIHVEEPGYIDERPF
jgi:hypothetical protein